jgi:hypothetical protein
MLSHCIIDTKTSALSGWVLLGLHFYLNKRYNTAIHVLEYTKSLTSLGQFPTCSVYPSLGLQPCNKHRSGNTAFSNSV